MPIRYLLTQLALPPALNIVLLLAGLLLLRRFRRLGIALIVLATASLLLMSAPLSKANLYRTLEIYPPLQVQQVQALDPQRSAIVILGGGAYQQAPEYGHAMPSETSWRRLQFGSRLAQQVPLPLLVSGGRFRPEDAAEADVLAQQLEALGQPVRWRESDSRNTWENARFSAGLLREAGIDTVVLVTDAWHQRRAVECFLAQGLNVVPAPTGFRHLRPRGLSAIFPSATALADFSVALREWQGLLLYRISYGTQAAPAPDGRGVIPAPGR